VITVKSLKVYTNVDFKNFIYQIKIARIISKTIIEKTTILFIY